MKRDVCDPEKVSVENRKMTPIHTATHTHGFVFDKNCLMSGLAGRTEKLLRLVGRQRHPGCPLDPFPRAID